MSKIDELLSLITQGDDEAIDQFWAEKCAEPPDPKENASELKDQEGMTLDDQKLMTRILQECNAQTQQAAKFWATVRALLATQRTQTWKENVLTRLSKGDFADLQGGEIETLVELLLHANEQELANRAAHGDFDIARVFMLPTNTTTSAETNS